MRVRLAMVALGALLAATAGVRAEEAYPSRAIRLIVPYGAGGASDVMARYFGQKLAEANVVIENMAAAALPDPPPHSGERKVGNFAGFSRSSRGPTRSATIRNGSQSDFVSG